MNKQMCTTATWPVKNWQSISFHPETLVPVHGFNVYFGGRWFYSGLTYQVAIYPYYLNCVAQDETYSSCLLCTIMHKSSPDCNERSKENLATTMRLIEISRPPQFNADSRTSFRWDEPRKINRKLSGATVNFNSIYKFLCNNEIGCNNLIFYL